MSYFEHDDAIRSMIRRARLLTSDDTGAQQLVDLNVLAGEKPKKVLRVLPFGLSSKPGAGSDGIVLALGGRSDRLVYLDGSNDKRPTGLPDGATALYDASGKLLKLFADAVDLDCGGSPITIHNASKITLNVNGTVVVVSNGRIDLGADPAPHPVMTSAGASSKVFAV